jgi:hypothetical protein
MSALRCRLPLPVASIHSSFGIWPVRFPWLVFRPQGGHQLAASEGAGLLVRRASLRAPTSRWVSSTIISCPGGAVRCHPRGGGGSAVLAGVSAPVFGGMRSNEVTFGWRLRAAAGATSGNSTCSLSIGRPGACSCPLVAPRVVLLRMSGIRLRGSRGARR